MVTFGQVAISASAVSCWRDHGGAADLAVHHRLIQDHVDLRRLRPAEQGVLPGGARRHPAFGVLGADGRAGPPDHLMGIAGYLEDPGHQVSVNPDAGRLSLHADVSCR